MSGLSLLFESVAISFYLDDMGVMEDAIEHGCRQRGVAPEGLIPLCKWQVAGQYHGSAFFVSLGHDLEEMACLIAGQGQVPDFIDNEQARSQHVVAQYGVISLLPHGGLQLQHQIGSGDELRFYSGLGRGVAQGDGHVGFTNARGTQQYDVLAPVDKPQACQFVDLLFRRACCKTVVVLIQGPDSRETSHTHQCLTRTYLADVAFVG